MRTAARREDTSPRRSCRTASLQGSPTRPSGRTRRPGPGDTSRSRGPREIDNPPGPPARSRCEAPRCRPKRRAAAQRQRQRTQPRIAAPAHWRLPCRSSETPARWWDRTCPGNIHSTFEDVGATRRATAGVLAFGIVGDIRARYPTAFLPPETEVLAAASPASPVRRARCGGGRPGPPPRVSACRPPGPQGTAHRDQRERLLVAPRPQDSLHRAVLERPHHHGAEPERGGLEADVLRRVARFHVHVPDASLAVLLGRARVHPGERDDRCAGLDAVLPERRPPELPSPFPRPPRHQPMLSGSVPIDRHRQPVHLSHHHVHLQRVERAGRGRGAEAVGSGR
jgi:hypothetical protein